MHHVEREDALKRAQDHTKDKECALDQGGEDRSSNFELDSFEAQMQDIAVIKRLAALENKFD